MNGVQGRTANVCKPDTPSNCHSFPVAVENVMALESDFEEAFVCLCLSKLYMRAYVLNLLPVSSALTCNPPPPPPPPIKRKPKQVQVIFFHVFTFRYTKLQLLQGKKEQKSS